MKIAEAYRFWKAIPEEDNPTARTVASMTEAAAAYRAAAAAATLDDLREKYERRARDLEAWAAEVRTPAGKARLYAV